MWCTGTCIQCGKEFGYDGLRAFKLMLCSITCQIDHRVAPLEKRIVELEDQVKVLTSA